VLLVLNNCDLNQVTWEQRVLAGDPKYRASQDVQPFNYADYAELLGLKGIRVESADEVGPAWDAALASDRPCVIDALTDPNVPPLPPHIKYDQAKRYAKAVLKGDPDATAIIWQSFKQASAGVFSD
jgi:pyruvate dehydrogenase (quinone)